MIDQILKALHCDNVPTPYEPVKLCHTAYETHSDTGINFGFQVYNPVTGEKRSIEGFRRESHAEATMLRCIEIMTGEHYERERERAPSFEVVGSVPNRWAEPGFDRIDGERDSRFGVCFECFEYLSPGFIVCPDCQIPL